MATEPVEDSSLYVGSLSVLPPEIRIDIWRLCTPIHRKLTGKRTFIKGAPRLSFQGNDIPVVLILCRESRAEALKVYKPLLKPDLGMQLYVHTSDSLCLETDANQSQHTFELTFLDIASCVRRVAALAPNGMLINLDSAMPHRQSHACDWCHWPFRGAAARSVYLIRRGCPPKSLGSEEDPRPS